MADENALFDSVFADLDKEPQQYSPQPLTAMDEAIDEVGKQSKLPTNIAAMKARDANPDQYQEIKTLSEKVGLDTGFVARNMPELKRQQTARDISDIADRSPELGMWFAKDDNAAAIKVDELRHTSGLWWLVASQVQAFKGGQQQVAFGELSNKALLGTATPEELARADEIFNGMQPRTYGADGWFEQAWVGANEQVPNLYNYVMRSLTGGAMGFGAGAVTGATTAAVGGQLGPQVATPEEVVTVPGAALATGIWMGRAGALSAAYLYSFEQTAGPAYYEFKSMTDENGAPMDDDVARVAAMVTGAIGGGLEVIGTEKLASLVPGADKVTGLFTKDAVKQALMVPSVREALKTFAVSTAEAGLTEVGTEVAQQAVQVFAGEMAKVASNNAYGTSFEAADAGEIADQLIQAADQTAKAMTILGPLLGSTRLGADLNKARRAGADKQILDAVNQHAANDELVKRLPAKSQEAVAAMIANGPIQSVYVQPEGIKTLFQSVEEMDAFIDSVGIRTEWNEANALGRDVQIPFEVYYAKLAATSAAEALQPFMRIAEDGMTQNDAMAFEEAWAEAKDALIADASADMERERASLSGADAIAEDVKTKAMNAGIVPDQAEQYSKLYSNFFRVMGVRLGLAPDEIYNRYGFDINRALPGGVYKPVDALDISLSAIRSGRIPSIRKRVEKARGSSLLERVRQLGGIEDVGGEIAATGLKGKQYIRKVKTGDMLGGADNSRKPDAVADQLWQEGYFPEHEERPAPDVLYEAIKSELGGQKRYSATVEAKRGPEIAELAGLVAFADMLDELGIDPGTMDDAAVRTALEAVNRDAEAGAMFQTAEPTDSAAFKAWFGDSKVVDADGKPLVVYHGTDSGSEFSEFDPKAIGRRDAGFYGRGFYFSPDLAAAEAYIENEDGEVSGSVMPVYLSLQSPFIWDSFSDEGIVRLKAAYEASGFKGESIDENTNLTSRTQAAFNRWLRAEGYDGVIRYGRPDFEAGVSLIDEIVAFQSTQIKSVNNRGTFDASDPRILYQDAKRGSIQISEGRTVINLFDQANLSTFLHESGHFFLEVFKDLAGQEAGRQRYYHGTVAEFDQFDAGKFRGGNVAGVYFTANKDSAWLKSDDPKFRVVEAELNLSNPASADDYRRIVAATGSNDPMAVRDAMIAEGFDGYIDENLDEVVVFDGAQARQPSSIASDWRVTAEYLGITGDTIPVEAHEKFARTFEAYLFEGKAPSEEVAGIMARFRSWLVFVYKSIQALNAPINDKIRGVMDRLLATDAEIASARTAPEFRSAFKSAADAGMTDAQWEAYQAQAGRAVDQAKRTMDARLLAEVARETTAEWREAKRKIRDDVQREYENEPVYRAMNYLRTGEWNEFADDGWPIPAPAERLYLDRAAIVSIMGEGALERMPRSVPPMYRTKGGVHPDYVAEMFGFQSGHDMLTRMMSVPSLARVVASETDVRMKEKFGDLMGDAVARAREAQEAITNDETGELLSAELEVLVKKGLVTTALRKQDAQRAAHMAIREKPIREALRQKLYMNANSKAAQEAERAILAKDWKAAVKAKQRQLVNHYMALEAVNAKKDVESALNYLGRFTGRKRPTTIDPEYLDQIEALLERFDLRKSVTLTDAQRRLSLAAWIEAQEAAGNMVQIPDTLRNDAFRKPYKSMTVEDLLGLQDTVKNIEHLGRLKNKLLANKEAREFAGARDEVVAAVAASQPEKAKGKTRNPTTPDKALSLLKSLDASMMKMEQAFDWMDGGDINGPLNRLVWRPIAEAEARENDMQVKYSGKFMEILQKLDPVRLNEWITFKDVKYQRSNIIAIALNMGNDGNYEKMKKAEVWTDAEVNQITVNLNAEEWQAVQEIWDTINELWPQIAALQKRLTGVEPVKVEPRDVVTPHGTLQGGYYPLIYDPDRSPDVEDRNAAGADKMFENTYLRPETWHGFTKERSAAYARPILFDLNGAGQHLISVIHDLTHREAIMDANKLLTNGDVRAEIENRYGKELYRQFVPWLQSIANDRVVNDGLSALNRVFRGIRSRATIVGMGFRVSTIITQVVGYSSSLEMVPAKRMAGAMVDFIRAPLAMNEEVNRLSGEMRHRSTNLDRDIRDQIRQQTGQKTLLEQARKFAFVGIGYADRVVTVPTWMAAYTDHLAQYPADKAGAIAHADKIVRLTGGSGGAKDLAAVTRGKNEAAKLITMFYSYFSAYYNRQRSWGRDALKAIKGGEYEDFPSLLARQVFMTVIPAVLGRLIVGQGPDDDESYAKWAARQVAMYPLSAVPIVRDAISTFDKGFGYAFTPAGQAVDEAAIQPFKLIGDMIDGEAEAREVVVQAMQTTGYVLKLPTGQLSSTTNNVWKAIENDDFQLRDLVLTRKK